MSSKLRICLSLFTIIFILACATPSGTETPATEVPIPTEMRIVHQIYPVNLPAERVNHAGDYDSSKDAENKLVSGGDRFTFERFERPFNGETMDTYFPNLDILEAFVYTDETWVYGTMQVKELSPAAGKYALQIDSDKDGKGDFLIRFSNPQSSAWNVVGVQVFEDANNDVGNITAVFTDDNAIGDGFEKLVFDEGKGDDSDAAFARISQDSLNTLEISVKLTLIGNPKEFMINMWAGNDLLDPALFDFSDHFTHEQAGAADPGYEIFYPIKKVYELDNTCRIAIGFVPNGSEPGICPEFVVPEPGIVIPPGNKPPVIIFGCIIQDCGNYIWDADACKCRVPE